MIKLIIKEDPTHPQSIIIDKWFNYYSQIYPDIIIERRFFSNNSYYSRLVSFIKMLQIHCPERLFAYIHALKEQIHLLGEELTNTLLLDIAYEVNCCRNFINLSSTFKNEDIEGFNLELYDEDKLLIFSCDFSVLNNTLDKLITKKIAPLSQSYLSQLFSIRQRLTWEELLFLYHDNKENYHDLQQIVSKLLYQNKLKMQKIANTVLLKLPSITKCCEGDECNFSIPTLL